MPYSKHALAERGPEIRKNNVAKMMRYRMKPHGKYRAHLRLAHARGIGCTISFDEFLILTTPNECYWCGGSLPISRAGLDRMDNTIGYVPGNCVPCCWSCNMMKGTLTGPEFIALCKKISERATNAG